MLNKSLVPFAYTYMYALGLVLMSKNLCHILYQEPTFYWKDIRIANNSSLAHDTILHLFVLFVRQLCGQQQVWPGPVIIFTEPQLPDQCPTPTRAEQYMY